MCSDGTCTATSGDSGLREDHARFRRQGGFTRELGVGVNVTPDPDAPTHAIIAAGWTPRVGSIHTPVHFFFVPEPSTNGQASNHRMGATVGVSW
jgi:hypothetical protein